MEFDHQRTAAMGTISGKTRNGYTWECDYEAASGGRILWNATFRHNGGYAGVRHGQLHDMQDVEATKLDELVAKSIESTWTTET